MTASSCLGRGAWQLLAWAELLAPE
jgi:hypothetical protein